MTRINVVHPSLLSDAHLGAEYRELPRVFGLVRAAIDRGEVPSDPRNPATYRLGAGHVRFFYTKLGYLRDRFEAIVLERRARGLKASFAAVPDLGIGPEWFGTYMPTAEAVAENIARINQRGGLRVSPKLSQRQL